jgi:hypothetical protein
MQYDVTIITARPGTVPKAVAKLEAPLTAGHAGKNFLACWYSEIGALNQILIIRNSPNLAEAIAEREAILKSGNPFGIGEFIAGMTMDTFTPFDFLKPMHPGTYGPFYEVRTYILKPEGLMPTIALWQKALPARAAISPLLTAMSSVSGPVTRFMHIWPYASLDDRQRLRGKSVADGVWPPPGGPDQLAVMQTDIYLPAVFSPMR